MHAWHRGLAGPVGGASRPRRAARSCRAGSVEGAHATARRTCGRHPGRPRRIVDRCPASRLGEPSVPCAGSIRLMATGRNCQCRLEENICRRLMKTGGPRSMYVSRTPVARLGSARSGTRARAPDGAIRSGGSVPARQRHRTGRAVRPRHLPRMVRGMRTEGNAGGAAAHRTAGRRSAGTGHATARYLRAQLRLAVPQGDRLPGPDDTHAIPWGPGGCPFVSAKICRKWKNSARPGPRAASASPATTARLWVSGFAWNPTYLRSMLGLRARRSICRRSTPQIPLGLRRVRVSRCRLKLALHSATTGDHDGNDRETSVSTRTQRIPSPRTVVRIIQLHRGCFYASFRLPSE